MKALFAGSFDPFTIGHKEIVDRALSLFGKVTIGIGYNENKTGEWTPEERQRAISGLYSSNPNVEVLCYTGLTVEMAKKINADFILRGIRGISDYEYEKSLADVNKEIAGIETVLLLADPSLSFITSSMVRELIHNGYDASKYIAGDFPEHKSK